MRELPSHIYKWANTYNIISSNNGVKTVHYKTQDLQKAIKKRKELINRGIIKHLKRGRPCKENPNRYIYRKKKGNGGYCIRKNINGKYTYFTTLPSLDAAREERDFLESINWDWDNIDAN